MTGNSIQFEAVRTIRRAETDNSGFAHFATYVRLMEETEYAFLRSRGLCVVLNDDRGTIGFPRLSVQMNIVSPARFDQSVRTVLQMEPCDGKQIVYRFSIARVSKAGASTAGSRNEQPVANGTFQVACCRFPDDADPYAILTPAFVMDALEKLPV